MKAAHAALSAGRLDEALPAFDWLWRHLLDQEPSMVGVRLSFLARAMGELCRLSPQARLHFQQLRDETEAAAGGRLDWVVLNEIVDETERTVAWFDGLAPNVSAARTVLGEPLLSRVRGRLLPLLRSRGRFADIAALYPDAEAELRGYHAVLTQAHQRTLERHPEDARDSGEAMAYLFREQAWVLTRSLQAAGRAEEARALADAALELDHTPELRAQLDAALSG